MRGFTIGLLLVSLPLYYDVMTEAQKPACDPLIPEYCLLPFPSSYYLAPNESTKTGFMVQFPPEAFLVNSFGKAVKPTYWNTFDGFSFFPMILAYFPNLSIENFPPHWNIAQSLSATSPSILLNADSSTTLAHWGELDEALTMMSNEKVLMVWPSSALQENTNYIVAFRNLKDSKGKIISPSPGFRCLRDMEPCNDSSLESRRGHFEQIFSKLEKNGFKREELQLAWDFQTASRDSLTGRLVYARDDAMSRTSPNGPSYVVDKVQDNYSQHIFRKISGIMDVPFYTTTALPGSKLVLDSNGLPVYQGKAPATFLVLVPQSLANGTIKPTHASVVQYGHGLFGSQEEVESGYIQELADRYGYVMIACDWWGMSKYDVASVVEMLITDVSDFVIVPDRLTQGMINALLLMRLMKRKFATDSSVVFDGVSVINPSSTYYYGNSQGGILGEVYMAASQDVVRGNLGVAGGPYGILLPRSIDFSEYEVGLRILFPDPANYTTMLALMNMIWSRLEPNAYMSSITENPLPNTPSHRILYQCVLGDAQVNIIGTYNIARSVGASIFSSNVIGCYELQNKSLVCDRMYGFNQLNDSVVATQSSVMMTFDCGAPPEPAINVHPDPKYDTHELARRVFIAQEQMHLFFQSGDIKNLCGGACKGLCKVN